MLHYQLNCLAGVREDRWVCGACVPRAPDRGYLVHQVVPGGFGHVDVEVGGGAADVLEGEGAVGVGDVLDVVKAAQGGADVTG